MNKNIRHFPLSDMAYSYYFDESIKAIDEKDFNNLSLSDLFELYPAILYEADLSSLNDSAKELYLQREEIIKVLKEELNKYFQSLNDDKFQNDVQTLHDIDSLLLHNYFAAFEEFFKKAVITNEAFLAFLNKELLPLYVVLEKKKISKAFSKPIKEYMVSSATAITLFVNEYDEKNNFGKKNHYHIPIELFSDSEIEAMIENYINYEFANLNIVNCLMYHKNGEGYSISPSMALKIKKAYKKLQDKLYKTGVVSERSFEIRIDPKQEEPVIIGDSYKQQTFSYGGKWIDDNIDNKATILNNFIYLFELVDLNFRFSYLPSSNSGSGITDAFDNRQKHEYGDISFKSIDGVSDTTFLAYYNYLRSRNVYLESVYEWFVNDYIKEEFEIDGFEISLPIGGELGLKCKNIFSEIDKLLKSYMVLQKYGSIESEIFELETLCPYHNLKSLNGQKYIYLTKDRTVGRICFLLFSDQSLLNYLESGKNETNFAKLIKRYELNISEYRDYGQNDLRFLKENDIISIDESGLISIKDYAVASLLQGLYFQGFFDVRKLGSNYQKVILLLKDKGWIEFSDTLFAKQEADYLSYYLNNKLFTNALALRNLYEHAGKLNADNNVLFSDYLKGLKIFALIAIKINDELCSKFPEKK